MFSIITIASSTTNPVEIVSAISERLSRLKPTRYMATKVPTSDKGTDRLGMMVAGRVRRNKKITTTTSATASASSNSTSATEARMVIVRSLSTSTLTAAGRFATIVGNRRLIVSTTSITFAPGWRRMLRIMGGVVFSQGARL